MDAYYEDDQVTLYLGDMREILPALGVQADLIVADPPYAETSLAWDRWPDGWPTLAATVASSMWCFGSMRMFLDRAAEFADWKLSQDVVGKDEDGEPVYADVNVVWEKHNGSSSATDRFKRVHEHALHWYRGGGWRDEIYHHTPRTAATAAQIARNGTAIRGGQAGSHLGEYDPAGRRWQETGTRLMRSVIPVQSMKGRAIHPTQKPSGILQPLIEYACPEGGLVVDPFAGSGSTLMTARMLGRRAVGIEANERYCELSARWLSQLTLEAS